MAFPTDALPNVVDLLIGGTWTDMTSRVRDTDRDPGILIVRGQSPESGQAQPSRMSLTFDNADRAMSNRVPTSPYYGLLTRGTQVRHRIRWVLATFAVAVSAAWPAADTGQTWTNTGGAASDFSSASGVGRHVHTSVNVFRSSVIETNSADMDVTVDAKLDIGTATGAAAGHWIAVRYVDASNYYAAQLFLTTTGTLTLGLIKRVGGTLTGIDTGAITIDASHTAGDWWTVRVSVRGSRVRAMAWPQGTTPPTAWQLSATDTSLTSGTKAALLSRLESGNTNTLNVTFSWDNFEYNDFRFWGEVAAWPPVGDATGNDVTVPIDAAGILRRIGGSKRPVVSPLTRAMAGVTLGNFTPIAFWPMEDDTNATQFGSYFPNQPAAQIKGSVTTASYTGFPGSLPLPVLNSPGQVIARLPSYTSTGVWQIQFAFMIPSDFAVDKNLFEVTLVPDPFYYRLMGSWDTATNMLRLTAYDDDGNQVDSNVGGTGSALTPGTPYLGAFTEVASGGDRYSFITVRDTAGNLTYQTQMVGLGGTVAGKPTQIRAIADSVSQGLVFGQVALYTDPALFGTSAIQPNARAAGGWAGETAADRLTRLLREAGIPFELIGNAADTELMGPQRIEQLANVLSDCVNADQGILYEPRDAFAVAYRTRRSLYNQTGPTLNYHGQQVSEPFDPVEDDLLLTNDVTVRRTGGSSARYQVTTGPNSVLDPPDGVGIQDTAPELNLYADTQCQSLAEWIGNRATWDEYRFQSLTADVADLYKTGLVALSAQVSAVDVGDYLAVSNPPAWLPPETIEMLATGYTEQIRALERTLTFSTAPAGPYTVGVYGSSRYDSAATTTNEPLDTTETGVDYVVAGRAGWATTAVNPGVFPFDIVIGGERMSVTSATATTFTVTRSVNGVVKTDVIGVPVRVYKPGRYAL